MRIILGACSLGPAQATLDQRHERGEDAVGVAVAVDDDGAVVLRLGAVGGGEPLLRGAAIVALLGPAAAGAARLGDGDVDVDEDREIGGGRAAG